MPDEPINPWINDMVKYTSEQSGYSLWFPTGWHQFSMDGGRDGVIYSPYPELPATAFLAEKTNLPFSVKAKDFDALREGFRKGLEALPNSKIEHQDEMIEGDLLGLGALMTFTENDQVKKRWTRVIYGGEAQLTLIAEGATLVEFEQFLPMFYNIMMSVSL